MTANRFRCRAKRSKGTTGAPWGCVGWLVVLILLPAALFSLVVLLSALGLISLGV